MASGLFGLIGVILGILLSKLAERLLDQRRRREREVDMVFALHAEISAGRSAAEDQRQGEEAGYLAENDFPAGPADRTDFVFDALKSDLSVLPQNVLHQVVLYYRLAEQSNLLVEFLMTPAYASQSADERKRYRINIIKALQDQDVAALAALDVLEAFLAGHGLAVPQRSRVQSHQRSNGAGHG